MQSADVKWNNLRPVLVYIEKYCRKISIIYFVFSHSVTSYTPFKLLVPILFYHCMFFNQYNCSKSVSSYTKQIRTGPYNVTCVAGSETLFIPNCIMSMLH